MIELEISYTSLFFQAELTYHSDGGGYHGPYTSPELPCKQHAMVNKVSLAFEYASQFSLESDRKSDEGKFN